MFRVILDPWFHHFTTDRTSFFAGDCSILMSFLSIHVIVRLIGSFSLMFVGKSASLIQWMTWFLSNCDISACVRYHSFSSCLCFIWAVVDVGGVLSLMFLVVRCIYKVRKADPPTWEGPRLGWYGLMSMSRHSILRLDSSRSTDNWYYVLL